MYDLWHIQGVSRLVDITAGGDFLGLCDQKSSNKRTYTTDLRSLGYLHCIGCCFIRRFLTKLRKATISFVKFVRLSVRMQQLRSHRKEFHEIWCLNVLRKSVEKVQVSLKSDKNKGYFAWKPIYLWSYLPHWFLEWEMFRAD